MVSYLKINISRVAFGPGYKPESVCLSLLNRSFGKQRLI